MAAGTPLCFRKSRIPVPYPAITCAVVPPLVVRWFYGAAPVRLRSGTGNAPEQHRRRTGELPERLQSGYSRGNIRVSGCTNGNPFNDRTTYEG